MFNIKAWRNYIICLTLMHKSMKLIEDFSYNKTLITI